MVSDRIQEYIREHTGVNILFVIKGYNFTGFENCATSLERTLQDKGARFMEIYQQPTKIISYEEFICLREIILSMFSKIYIFENRDYINLFPVRVCIQPDIISALCAHYDEDELQEDVLPESLVDYIDIYSNFLKIGDQYACRYNLDESYLLNEKIERLFISEDTPCDLFECPIDSATILSICEESDYFYLAYELEKSDSVFAVSLDNAAIGKTVLQNKLRGLCGKYPGRLFSYTPPVDSLKRIRKCPQKIYDTLQQYWGYSSFRSIKMYDLAAIENHQKKVVTISQEDIICDLIEQSENCVAGKNYRDIFVTAPTGSGKSLMFQLPAIYLAEKYGLLTLVITPLIGLMKDQVQNLEELKYTKARTINSDISPIVRDEILASVASGECDILYLSPESLLSRSDVEQLIGKRKIGMLVVDESHIVTTWGKQFRPDYWYLGDHIRKLRKRQSQSESNPAPFIIATFTATAIYGGNEDMYHETLNSLHIGNKNSDQERRCRSWSAKLANGKAARSCCQSSYKAAFICLTYSPMYGGASLPYRSSSLTIAEPTMAPSEISAIFLACSGVEMPNPMAQGIRVFSRTTFIMAARSVLISLLTPVTPRLETIYKKPSASLAIMAMRFSDVGAMRDTRSTWYLRHRGKNSSFSSKGRSGRMSPSIPTSLHLAMKRSAP